MTQQEQQQLTNSPQQLPPQEKKSTTFFFSFPTPVKLILFNELTERFAYYGNRAILTLFLTSIDLSPAKAVVVFSLQSALSCTMPLLGGHIADAWWGRYWTIVIFSMVYFFGALLLAFAANPTFIDSRTNPYYVYFALLLTALGTGGIKPCVSTFGAEQIMTIKSTHEDEFNNTNINDVQLHNQSYIQQQQLNINGNKYNDKSLDDDDEQLNLNQSSSFDVKQLPITSLQDDLNDEFNNGNHPIALTYLNSPKSNNTYDQSQLNSPTQSTPLQPQQQHEQLQQQPPQQEEMSSESFFITFYFMMNVGSIMATLIIPIVRTRVSYFWAFLLPATFMLISVIILLIGHAFKQFKLTPPDGGILGNVFRVIFRTCLRRRYRQRSFLIPIPIQQSNNNDLNDNNGWDNNDDDYHNHSNDVNNVYANDFQSIQYNNHHDTTTHNQSSSTIQKQPQQYQQVLVNVHDFVRFIHLNYDYVMNRLYNPTFNAADNTITAIDINSTNNNNNTDIFHYEKPQWLVPVYSCPYDVKQQPQLQQQQSTNDIMTPSTSRTNSNISTSLQSRSISTTSNTSSQKQRDIDEKNKMIQKQQLTINYGSCQCSEGCTCGCDCNSQKAGLQSNDIQQQQQQQQPSDQFSRHLYKNPPSSPCQCSQPPSNQQLIDSSTITLHHFQTTDVFLHPSNNIRSTKQDIHPHTNITHDNDSQFTRNISGISLQGYPSQEQEEFNMNQITFSPNPSLMDDNFPKPQRTLLCLPKYTHLHQIFTTMDLSSDEYTILDYIDTNSFTYKNSNQPLTIDDLLLPLFYHQHTNTTTTTDIISNENDIDDDLQSTKPFNTTIDSSDSYQPPQMNNTKQVQIQQQQIQTNEQQPNQKIISGSFIQSLRVVLVIIPVLCTLPVFWSLMNQQGSTWMVQAQEMDLNLYIFNLHKKGWKIEPEQLSILNPIFLFVFLPLLEKFARCMKSKENNNEDENNNNDNNNQDGEHQQTGTTLSELDSNDTLITSPTTIDTPLSSTSNSNTTTTKNNNNSNTISATSLSSPLTKMIFGMGFAAIAYICAAGVDYFIKQAAKTIDPTTGKPRMISILWQIPQYLFVTIAEVCISVTGLYFVFDMSPSNMKSLVNALYLFSGAMGDFLTGLFYTIFVKWGFSRLQMFLAFAVCIMINSLGIVIIQRMYGKLYKFK